MKNTTHRVVILKNMNSGLISQAILILKDSATENNSALLAEAEQIVEKYMSKGTIPAPSRKKSRLNRITPWFVALFVVCIAAVVYLV